ncbi:MAG TPA: hypothetical protein VMY35_19205 [Phycisphaerae bacterium]|nr:hypothetical protein [Phycisphaerae bacterium]
MTTVTDRSAEVKQAAPVTECEACAADEMVRSPEVFLVGDRYLCLACILQNFEGPGDSDGIDAFEYTIREMQNMLDAIDPEKKGWASLRAGVAKGLEAVKILKAV